MNITFVTATLTSGGSERVISILANELTRRGHEVSVIMLREPIVFYSLDESIKLHCAQEYSTNILGKIIWLRKFVRKEQPDVVIPFMTAVYCTTILALLGLNTPVIASERIDPRFSSNIRKVLRWCLLRFVNHLVVQTQAIKQYYSSKIQAKTMIIPNPVSDNMFEEISSSNRKEKIIVSVGRLYSQKNQKMMIDAFASIAHLHQEYKLIIYGEGPLRQQLMEYIEIKNLSSRVLLPGRVNNVAIELRKAEIFCLSSDYEGQSNALLEAICIGLPIVTTNVSGVEDIITNGTNGFVVNVGDTKTFAQSLNALLENETLRVEFAKYNKALGNTYKVDKIVDCWESLIKQVVQ